MHAPALLTNLLTATNLTCAASSPVTPKSIGTIAHFPFTWLENLALRSNGDILATSLLGPFTSVYLITPAGETCSLTKLPATVTTGIAELAPDIFAFATNGILPGHSALYTLDLNTPSPCTSRPSPTLLTRLPNAGLLNGLTILPGTRSLAIADTFKGLLWAADADTGAVSVLLNTSETRAGPPNASKVNGLKAADGFVYFTNEGAEMFARAPVDGQGEVIGPVEVLREGLPGDDFALLGGGEGAAYVASGERGAVVFVDGERSVEVDIATIKGPTAVARGRLPGEERVLYVSTNGGMGALFLNSSIIRIVLE